MIPKKLSITNFRSFRDTQTFTFPTKPGLYFLTGDNQAETRLEANGAGKSSIWDALCWVLFGKTPRGLKAGDVSNWDVGGKTCVAFQYELDGLDYIVSRTWGPNSWTLSGQDGSTLVLVPDDPSNPVLAAIRADCSPFLHSIIMAQSSDMFLDLKASEKEAVVAEVLSFDEWLGYSDKASKQASTLDLTIRSNREELDKTIGQLSENKAQDFTQDAEDYETGRKEDLEKITTEHKEKAAKVNGIKNNRGGLLRNIEILKTRERTANMTRQTLLSELSAKRREVDEQEEEVHGINATFAQFDIQVKALREDTCHSCGQRIGTEYRMRQLGFIDEKRRGTTATLTTLNKHLSKLQNEEHEISEEVAKLDSDIQTLEDAHRTSQRELDVMDSELRNLNNQLDTLETRAEELLNKSNPFEVRMLQQTNRAEELAQKRDDLQTTLDDQSELLRRLQYWVRGFKEIRLYLIAEATNQLELEVNSSLTQLGLMDWKLRFDVDRDNKGGKIQKGFSVMVLSTHNKDAVPWEAWSGGESQRLRIAAEMGLSNLIRSSRGVSFPIEVWDEPTAHLSAQGVSDLLDCLANRARDNRRQIWVVDHRSLGYGDFDGTVTVIKDENGSRIAD